MSMKRIAKTFLPALALTLASLAFGAGVAHAGPKHENFTTERYEQLQQEEAVFMVEVWASWCSTCRAQGKALETLQQEEQFADVTILRLDWDEQKDEAGKLNAWRQSTLIMNKGDKEMARVVAETREANLRSFMESGL